MPTVYALGATNISVSDSESLSGGDQGSGVHLQDKFITLDSNAWEAVDINDTDNNFADSDTNQTLDGQQSFNNTTYDNGLVVEAEYQLTLRAPDGTEYTVYGFNVREPGAPNSYGTVEGLAFFGSQGGFPPIGVPLEVVGTMEGPSTGYQTLATPICFTKGGMIATPTGEVAVEDLKVGDLVETLDHGPQVIRWVGSSRYPRVALDRNPNFRPVWVKAGALGPNVPSCDTLLSPQHRVLICGWQAELLFGEVEVLVPIHKLINDQMILRIPDDEDVEYFHVLFDHHEVIWCNGMPSESLLPAAQYELASDEGKVAADEALAILPFAPCDVAKSSSVRSCLNNKEVAVLRDMLAPRAKDAA
ncbi:Hint domain-containing protein [Algirhabdus cladophorae]|uniref:Hint domain-containing protein n=1 Tax=Algirhabdus cladophorae TaxID=3377108 RepID=UPI003B84742C